MFCWGASADAPPEGAPKGADAPPEGAPKGADPSTPADSRTIEQLKAEIEELRARENRGQTIIIQQQQINQQQQLNGQWESRVHRVRMRSYFDLWKLSSQDQQRYRELDKKNKRIAVPIVLTSVSFAGFIGVFVAYAMLAGMTCEDPDTGRVDDCSMPAPMLATAIIPAAGMIVGGILLAKRVPSRREFRLLYRKGIRVEPVFGWKSASVTLRF
jgi:hypothetical protein